MGLQRQRLTAHELHRSENITIEKPLDGWSLTENLALRFEPIIKGRPMLIAPFSEELIGPLGGQNMQVIARRHRQGMKILGRRSSRWLLRGRCPPVRFCRTNAERAHRYDPFLVYALMGTRPSWLSLRRG